MPMTLIPDSLCGPPLCFWHATRRQVYADVTSGLRCWSNRVGLGVGRLDQLLQDDAVKEALAPDAILQVRWQTTQCRNHTNIEQGVVARESWCGGLFRKDSILYRRVGSFCAATTGTRYVRVWERFPCSNLKLGRFIKTSFFRT